METTSRYKQALTANLALAQENAARNRGTVERDNTTSRVLFSIFTEDINRPLLVALVRRYFQGATITYGYGIFESKVEASARIDIIARLDALQEVTYLAGDIKQQNGQSVVLVSWQRIGALEV